jgi:hypothetical protein
VSDTFVCPVCGLVRDDTDAHQSGPNDPVVCSDCFVPAVSTMTEAEFMDLVVEVFARGAVIV